MKRERLEIFDILKIAKEGYEKSPVKISKIEFSSYPIFQNFPKGYRELLPVDL